MYHAVKITEDNALRIIKWLPTEAFREEFRDSLNYLTPGLVYYAVLELPSEEHPRGFLIVREDVVQMVPLTDLCIITLES